MTKFTKKLFAAASASAMFLSIVGPVAAETSIEVTGNGYNSDNTAVVTQTNTTNVIQSNSATVVNHIDADADTGDNDANYNTGGSTGIVTGNALTDVNVVNELNRNVASVDCCVPGDTEVEISGNGAESDNDAVLIQANTTNVYQDNWAWVKNKVDADADTGDNDANYNTGGDVVVSTGNAKTYVDVATTANSNLALVGGNGAQAGGVSALITGNGYNADSDLTLTHVKTINIAQDNWAWVDNHVDAEAETGDNDANYNTGGDAAILTGNALTDIDIDNHVNFNAADVDCGCLFDLDAKIGANGADTDNDILAAFIDSLYVDQGFLYGNIASLSNHVDTDSDTGENDVEKNTGLPEGDPFVLTGDSASYVDVENSGNVNLYGDFGGFHMPELPELDLQFSLSLNWSHLLGLLSLLG